MRRRDGDGCTTPAASRRHRGAAAVEAAFVLPMLLTMFLFMLEMGRLFEARTQVINAARTGARLASSGLVKSDAIADSVKAALQRAGLNVTRLTVVIRVEGNPDNNDPTQASPAADHVVHAVVRLPVKDVLFTSWFLTDSQLGAEAVWPAAKDQGSP